MNQFSSNVHTADFNFKTQVLTAILFLFLVADVGTKANAQCTVNPVANQAVCHNSASTAIVFTGTATSFNWTNNTTSIGLAASGTGNIASFTALNPGANAVTATITVTPVSGACTGTPINFTITVNPLPVVNVSPTAVCGGLPGIGGPCNPLTSSGNGNTYIWSPLAGLYTNCTATTPYTGGSLASVYPSPLFNTVYTVTGTITATGCINTATAQVNATPPSPVVIPPSVNMCMGDPPVKLTAIRPGIPTPVQFCSGPVNIAVPDNNPAGASNSITVSGINCTVSGISVTINMQHTRIGDMVFVLRAPNGQIINLDYHLTATGGVGATTGFFNTMISSGGTAALSTGTNPYTATFRADTQIAPSGGFGAPGPTGMQPTTTSWNSLLSVTNGVWTLGFYDGITGETGILNSWCLGMTLTCGYPIPVTAAVWSPAAGLFLDAAAAIPYVAGSATDIVYTRPVPAGVYPYQVTTQGVPPTLCSPATNFAATNGNSTVTFNIRNNHPYPIRLSQIDSKTLTAGATSVLAFYKTAAINGLPGPISTANGWIPFGSAGITATGTGIQTFLTGSTLTIPPGATYGMCVQATTPSNLPNLAYSALSPGNYSFNDGGCELITGSNIGYSGASAPAAPTVTESGFVGKLYFQDGSPICTSFPRTVVVTVGLPITITTQPVDRTVCPNSMAVFSVATGATGSLTYQWQESSNGGASYNNIINAGVFSGATTATLTINPTSVAMNGNLYRVLIVGTGSCTAATSAAAKLTVNARPVVSIWAHPYYKLLPPLTTTISSLVSPNAATYLWIHDGFAVPGATADTLFVNFSGLGLYQLRVTDINGCMGISDTIRIKDSAFGRAFVYPNPNGGQFQVRSYSAANDVLQRILTVYNNMGVRVFTKSYNQSISYQSIDVDIRARGKGMYWIEIKDLKGKRVSMSHMLIQ